MIDTSAREVKAHLNEYLDSPLLPEELYREMVFLGMLSECTVPITTQVLRALQYQLNGHDDAFPAYAELESDSSKKELFNWLQETLFELGYL